MTILRSVQNMQNKNDAKIIVWIISPNTQHLTVISTDSGVVGSERILYKINEFLRASETCMARNTKG